MSEIYQWSIRDWSASPVRDWSMISRRLICCIYPRKINDQPEKPEIDKLHLSENDQWSNRRWISCTYQRLINDQPEIDQLLNLSEIDQWSNRRWISCIYQRLINDQPEIDQLLNLSEIDWLHLIEILVSVIIWQAIDLIFQFQLRKPSTFCPFLV